MGRPRVCKRTAPQIGCRSSISDCLLGCPDIWLLRELVWFEPGHYERLVRLGLVLPQQSKHYSLELPGERPSQRIRLLISTRHYLLGFKLPTLQRRSEQIFICPTNHRPARARMSTRLSVLSASGSSGLLVIPMARRQRLTRSPSAVRRPRTTSAESRFFSRYARPLSVIV